MLKQNAEIDLENSQKNIKAYIEITENKKYAFLILAEDDSVVYSKEARENAKKTRCFI